MRYVALTQADVNNGDGCRTTLWVAGCNHQCKGCHNAWTWNYKQGKTFDQIRDKLDEYLDKKYIKGLTISGGDPLDQTDENLLILESTLRYIRDRHPDKDIWLYTGFEYSELRQTQLNVLKYIDVLVDGPFIEEQKDLTLPFRGSRNQNIIYMKDLV